MIIDVCNLLDEKVVSPYVVVTR